MYMGSVAFAVGASERGHSGSRLIGSSVYCPPAPPRCPILPLFVSPLCFRRSSLRVVDIMAAASCCRQARG